VFLGTTAAIETFAGPISYGPLKAALIVHAKELARALAPDGVRVNVVSPGPIFFPDGAWDQIREHQTPLLRERARQLSPGAAWGPRKRSQTSSRSSRAALHPRHRREPRRRPRLHQTGELLSLRAATPGIRPARVTASIAPRARPGNRVARATRLPRQPVVSPSSMKARVRGEFRAAGPISRSRSHPGSSEPRVLWCRHARVGRRAGVRRGRLFACAQCDTRRHSGLCLLGVRSSATEPSVRGGH